MAHKTVFEEDSFSREKKEAQQDWKPAQVLESKYTPPNPNQTKPKQQWSSYSLRRCQRLQALFQWGEAATTREIGGKNGPCTPYTYKIHQNVKYLLWSLAVVWCNSSKFSKNRRFIQYSTKQRTSGSFSPYKNQNQRMGCSGPSQKSNGSHERTGKELMVLGPIH